MTFTRCAAVAICPNSTFRNFRPNAVIPVFIFVCLLAAASRAVAAPPAFIALPERIELAIGESLDLAFAAADPDGDEVLVTIDGLPGWLNVVYGDPDRNIVETLPFPEVYGFVEDMETDREGNLYLAADHRADGTHILKIDRAGTLSVLASGLWNVSHIALTPDGQLYYAEDYGLFSDGPLTTKIYRLNADGSGTLINDTLDLIFEMDTDAAGKLILLRVNKPGTVTQVLKMAPADGSVQVLAGSAVPQSAIFPRLHEQLAQDGAGEAALFAYSPSLFVGSDGMIYVPDLSGRIRKVTPEGIVSTLGMRTSSLTRAIVADGAGRNFFMFDGGIQFVDAAGASRTIVGNLGEQTGALDGRATAARFRSIVSVALHADGSFVLADWQTQFEPWQPLLRTVKFDARGIEGRPDIGDHGEVELTLTARDGNNTVTRKLVVSVNNHFRMGDTTRLDFTLTPGMTVEGNGGGLSVLRGAITGDAANPGKLRRLHVQAGSSLQNVVIGDGVTFGRGVRLLANVRFESYMPPGLVLDALIGYVPGTGSPDGRYPGIVDLNAKAGDAELALIDEIRSVSTELARDGAVQFSEDGLLIYVKDDLRLAFRPLRVESGDRYSPAYTSGIYFDSSGTRYINTSAGHSIFLVPAVEEIPALAFSLLRRNLYLGIDLSGVYMVTDVPAGGLAPIMALLPDPASMKARAGLASGFHRLPHPEFPGYSYYLHVFASGFERREQAFYPTALAPPLLGFFLNPWRTDNVVLLPTGGVDLHYDDIWLRLMPALNLAPSTAVPGFRLAGDLNADGLPDYRMVYPSPLSVEQVYYGLPQ